VIRRIVSGGQTGADRAALDFALERGLEHGGWVPRGRLAEDGPIPTRYGNLIETSSADARVRTEWNVRDSDATLVITQRAPTGGSAYTMDVAHRLRKPCLHVDLGQHTIDEGVTLVQGWLTATAPAVLNVAGPRASGDAEIYALTLAVLRGALGEAPAPRRWAR